MTHSSPPPSSEPVSPPRQANRATVIGDRIVLFIARHWLAMANIGLFVFVAMPFMAPVFMRVGLPGAARVVHMVYFPTCHQLPDRSYFLFGEQPVYSVAELQSAGVLEGTSILQRRSYKGDATLGYKVALCERDVAIYGSMVIGGLIFAVLRKRRRIRGLPIKYFLIAMLPIAIDGFSQLFGLRTSNWALRTLTGAIFGLAVVWLAYPNVEDSMEDIRITTERRLAQETGQIDQGSL